jgi:quercetin dioxygenase-like cupin family protein
MTQVQIIRHKDIPAIESAVVDGVKHFLGDHRDFRRNKVLAEFIPENARLAIAWVRLNAGEVLEIHAHPIESMILICEGNAEFNGDFNENITAGDSVIVPRGARHGFRGMGPSGFLGISIQFEQRGLYENHEEALVKFESGD